MMCVMAYRGRWKDDREMHVWRLLERANYVA